MSVHIWIILKKQFQFMRCKDIKWCIAHTAGIFTDAKEARKAAERYTEDSDGWKFKAQRYRRG